MSRRPKRPLQHVLEELSRRHIRGILPAEWITDDVKTDYGIDLSVQLVTDNNVTGATFLIQAKATQQLKINRSQAISYSEKTISLRHYLDCSQLVLFIIYDASSETAYWIWVQDYIRNSLPSGWDQQKTATIHIPVGNRFDANTLSEIEARVFAYHPKSTLLNAVNSIEHEHYEYVLKTSKEQSSVSIVPKQKRSTDVAPIIIKGGFKFGMDPEGQKAHDDLVRSMKTGSPVKIEGKFVDHFTLPEVFTRLTGSVEQSTLRYLELIPSSNREVYPMALAILDEKRSSLFHIPYVELRNVQAGLEEMTFKAVAPRDFVQLTIVVNKRTKQLNLSVEVSAEENSVTEAKKYYKIKLAISQGAYLVINHLKENLPPITIDISEMLLRSDDKILLELLNRLESIEHTLNMQFTLPAEVSSHDELIIKKIGAVLDIGVFTLRTERFGVWLDRDTALSLLDSKFKRQINQLVIYHPNDPISLFGCNISLGEFATVFSPHRIASESEEALQNLENSKQTKIPIEFTFNKVGEISFFYRNWLQGEVVKYRDRLWK